MRLVRLVSMLLLALTVVLHATAQTVDWKVAGVTVIDPAKIAPGSGAPTSEIVTGTPVDDATPQPVTKTAPPAEVHGDTPYRILRPTEIAPGGELARLSPDGSRIAFLTLDGSTDLCVLELGTGDGTCADIGITSRNLQAINWAPTSTALVFTSEPILTGMDTDIWHLDAITGEVTNLTDDETEILAKPGSAMDVHPGWTPDGDIIFQRYEQGSDSEVRVSLMRISPDGDEAEELIHFPQEYATVMSGPAILLENGSVMLATMPATGFTTGLFRVAPDGKFEHLADNSLLRGQDSLVLLDVTADGSTAIVYGRASYELRFYQGALGLLDVDTGEMTQPASLDGIPAAPATFSPDGTRMLSVLARDDGTLVLMLTDLARGEVSELHRIEPTPGEDEAMWPLVSLIWAENDTVLLHTGTPTSVMLSLAK